MSATVNIGSIEALLKLVDHFTGPMKEISTKLDKITDAIENDFKRTDKAVDKLGLSFTNLGKEVAGNLTKYFTATVLVSGGIAALKSVTEQLVAANIEAEESEKRVEEAVRRYGKSSGITVDEINSLAQAQSRLTGIDDEVIADAEVMALKFNRISSNILPEVTKAALDLSVATGQDLSASIEKVGKLVNQPLKALTLLGREGYAVSASQAKLVKDLAKTGDVLGAQNEILGILKSQYGGAAVAARDTMGGALKALGTTWENFLERVGQDNMGPLRSALESLITLLEKATDGVKYVEIGFHSTRAAVNGFISDALGGIADLIDLLSDSASLLGGFGIALGAIGKDVSARARAGADIAGEDAVKHGMKAAMLLADIGKEHKKGTGLALEQTEAEAKLGKELNKLADSIRLSIEEMQRKANNARDLWLAALISTKAYNAELLKQKVVAAILQEENKLRETGGKLTETQKNAIAKAVIEEDQFNKKLEKTLSLNKSLLDVVLTVTDNISRMGFESDFQRNIDKVHEGMRLISVDVDEMLKGLGAIKDLDLDMDFSSRLNSVDPHLRELEKDYLSFLERIGSGFEQEGETALDAGERILTKIGTRFGKTIDEVKAKLQTLADIDLAIEFKSQLNIPDTPNKKLLELQKTLKRLQSTTDDSGKSLLTAAEAHEIYSKAVSEGLRDFAVSAMGVIETLYSLSSESNKWGKALSGLSGVIASGGANIGAWLEMFVGIAEGFTDKGGVHAGAELNTGAAGAVLADSWTMVKGQLKEIQKQAKEIADAINDTVSALGGILVDLPGIELLQKGEGWVVNIEGELRRYFDDFNEAVAYAASKAIQESEIYNIDDEILKAFKDLDFSSLEEIREFTDYAREYTSYGASDLTSNLKSLTQWLLESSRKTIEFGLSVAKVGEEFGRRAQAWRDQVLGIVLSPDEKIHRDVQDFNKWAEQESLSAQIQIDAASSQMIAAKLQMDAARAEIKAMGMDRDPEMIKLFLEAERLFKEAGLRLDLWTKALENIPPPITPEEEAAAKKRRRGGGGKNSKDTSLRDWIDDREFDLNTRGMDEYQKSVLEKEREYQDKLNELGKKDKKLREELIALRDRELEQLEKERIESLEKDYTSFTVDVSDFQQIRDTANALIHDIENSPIGNERKAEMIGNILREVDEQLQDLSDHAAADLFGSLAGMLEDGEQKTELLRAQFILNHQLQLVDAKARYAQLVLEGNLTQAHLKLLGGAIAAIEAIDINDLFNLDGGFSSNGEGTKSGQLYNQKLENMNKVNEDWIKQKKSEYEDQLKAIEDAAEDLARKLEKANDLLDSYRENELDPLTKKLFTINTDFDEIESALGKTPEIISTHNKAIAKAYEEALTGIKKLYTNLTTGAQGGLTVESQFKFAKAEFNRIVAEVLNADYSELGNLESVASSFIDLLGKMTGTSTKEFELQKQPILDQLSKVLKIGEIKTPVPSATVIQFPSIYQETSNKILDANNNIANVIDIRSARQEKILLTISDKISEMNDLLSQLNISSNSGITYGS